MTHANLLEELLLQQSDAVGEENVALGWRRRLVVGCQICSSGTGQIGRKRRLRGCWWLAGSLACQLRRGTRHRGLCQGNAHIGAARLLDLHLQINALLLQGLCKAQARVSFPQRSSSPPTITSPEHTRCMSRNCSLARCQVNLSSEWAVCSRLSCTLVTEEKGEGGEEGGGEGGGEGEARVICL